MDIGEFGMTMDDHEDRLPVIKSSRKQRENSTSL